MKYMKDFLICMGFCTALFAASGCTGENDLTGTGNDENGNLIPLVVRATAADFDGLPQQPPAPSDTPLTRTTGEGTTLAFGAGDAIGIFAVKDGAIVDGINNNMLTYTENTGAGNWSTEAGKTLYYYEGVDYIAYYPYKEGTTLTAGDSKTADGIKTWLKNKFPPAADQSAPAAYVASDLMIASNTVANGASATDKVLTLNFQHQYSLIILNTRVFKACTAPAGGGFKYRASATAPLADANATDVTVAKSNDTGSSFTAYKAADGRFHVIVPSVGSTVTLSGLYDTKDGNNADQKIHYTSTSYSGGITAGKCYTLRIDATLTVPIGGERPLAPGDFVFHGANDIEIYPGDGALTNGKIPDYNSAVGIVVTCNPERLKDADCNAAGWTHAYVAGFYDMSKITNHSWGQYRDNSNLCTFNNAVGFINGYTETQAILRRSDITDLTYPIFYSTLTDIENLCPIPSDLSKKRSSWFYPSMGQVFDYVENLCGTSPTSFSKVLNTEEWKGDNVQLYNNLKKHYDKWGKSVPISYIWTCSEYDQDRAWVINVNNSFVSFSPYNRDKWTGMQCLPFFAF